MQKTLRIVSGLIISTLTWESAYAAVLPSGTSPKTADFRAEDFIAASSGLREELTRSLDDPTVATELRRQGVERAEVERRLAGMTDHELDQVAKNVQRQAGGDTVIIGTTTLLLIVIIVILLVK